MAETKHEPGPWDYVVNDNAPKEVTLLRRHWRVGSLNSLRGVALVFGEDAANARLIAASPARDDILRRLAAMAEDGFDLRDYDGAQHEGWPSLLAEIKATLRDTGGD